MLRIKTIMKEKYSLSNYQIAQLEYLFKTLASEFSKMLLLGLLFRDRLLIYLFSLVVLLCIRSISGGIHFYTYMQCLIATGLYLWTAIYMLGCNVFLPSYAYLLLMAACLTICHQIGPIRSKYRPPLSPQRIQSSQQHICLIIFVYALLGYMIPENSYINTGYWIIILHTLQLCAAKLLKKGVESK